MEWYKTVYILQHLTLVFTDLPLIILHNNDIRGHYSSFPPDSNLTVCEYRQKCIGGLPRIIALVKSYRKAAKNGQIPDTLYFFAGNLLGKGIWQRLHKENIASELMNMLSPNATSLGKSDFSMGVKGLSKYLGKLSAHIPVLAANLDVSGEPDLKRIKPSAILVIKGKRIGIIGYVDRGILDTLYGYNVKVADPVNAVKLESKRLSDRGVEIIIALGAESYETDCKIAKEIPEVDLVIGGNGKILLYNGRSPIQFHRSKAKYPKVIKQVDGDEAAVVQTADKAVFLGCLNIVFDKDGEITDSYGNPIYLSNDYPEDRDAAKLIETRKVDIDQSTFRVIGFSTTIMQGSEQFCLRSECNLGNLLTDAIVNYVAANDMSSKYWTSAAIGIITGSTMTQGINPLMQRGDITIRNLLEAIPDDNEIGICSLPGEILYATLENSVANMTENTTSPDFLQYSGIRVKYDLRKPKYFRVTSVKVRCADCPIPQYVRLEENKMYKIVTNDYLMTRAPGHRTLGPYASSCTTLKTTDTAALEWYLRKFSPVFPEEESRIEIKKYSSGASVSVTFQVYFITFSHIILETNN